MALSVLVAAEESAGARAVQQIADAGHYVAAVLTGGNEATASGPVAHVASSAGIAVLPASTVKDPDLARRIREWDVDLLVNVHSLHLIHEKVLGAPRIGSFNLHPGPLPRYAGLNALSWAIYGGEPRYGTTLHWMQPSVDTGAIAYQTMFEIEEAETALSLGLKCINHGLPLLTRLLEDAADDPASIPATPQQLELREYFGKHDVPDGMWVDWAGSAAKIERLVRACRYDPYPSPWGKPRARVEDQEIEIAQVALTGAACEQPPGSVRLVAQSIVEVATGDEWIRVEKIVVDGESRAPTEILTNDVHLASGSACDHMGTVASRADAKEVEADAPQGQVLKIFHDKLHLSITANQEELIDSGRLDSLSFVDLLLELERAFAIQIDLAEVDFEDFRSVDAIAAFVERTRGAT